MWSSPTGKVWPVKGARSPVVNRCGRACEEAVEVGARVGLERNLEVAVADHVEEDHRLDLVERSGALLTGPGVLDVLAAAAIAVGFEVVSARLLGVEEGELDRRPGQRLRQGARELEQDGDARGAVVGADEVRDAALGVVMGADHDRPRLGARDRRDDVAIGALDADVLRSRALEATADQPLRLVRGAGPARAWPEVNLRGKVVEGALAVKCALRRARRGFGVAAAEEDRADEEGGGEAMHRWVS